MIGLCNYKLFDDDEEYDALFSFSFLFYFFLFVYVKIDTKQLPDMVNNCNNQQKANPVSLLFHSI